MPEANVGPADLDLASCVREARQHWPAIATDEEAFRRHLMSLGRPRPPFALDAFLAAACSAGDGAALQVFDAEVLSRVMGSVGRVDPSPAFTAEIRQQLRVRLFVQQGGEPPRIARYTGDVPLAAWVRVIALRLAFNEKRGGRDKAASLTPPESAALDDPEIEVLRAQYREPFARAFEAALAGLPKDDRTVLRLYYVDGANIEGIGRIFQVHRATVARWLVRIRTDVLVQAKVRLAEQVGADLEEAASVMAALAADVDVTLSRVLGGASVRVA
jgi:RNA polymerase sigma-70 factor (ECF subfamily)